MKKKCNKFTIGGFIVGILVSIMLLKLILFVGIYNLSWDGPLTKKIVSVVPHPIAMVDFKPIRYSDFLNDIDALLVFSAFEAQQYNIPAPTKNQLKKTILQQFINQALLESRAKSYGIKITDQDVQDEFNVILGLFATTEEDFAKEIKKVYTWDLDTFKEKVVRYQVLEDKLMEKIAYDENIPGNKERIEDATTKINSISERLKAGELFSDIASIESDDFYSAQQGGDIGEQPRGTLLPAIEDFVYNAADGDISEPIRTDLGFYIIKVEKRIAAEEEGGLAERALLSQILVKTITPPDYLAEIEERASIFKFVNDEKWELEL